MKILLEKLRPYGFNERVLTENDFFSICKAENIRVLWSNEKFSFFFSAIGERCIVLPKRLRGLRLLFAMWHEYGHAALSPGHPYDVQWHEMHDGKDEFQADAVALIALMPVSKMFEILDGSEYATYLLAKRQQIWLLYGV